MGVVENDIASRNESFAFVAGGLGVRSDRLLALRFDDGTLPTRAPVSTRPSFERKVGLEDVLRAISPVSTVENEDKNMGNAAPTSSLSRSKEG